MNEKYIQAAILGSLIGGAIVLDDFIKPDSVSTEFKSIDDLKLLDDLKDIDVVFMQNTDWYKEAIGQQEAQPVKAFVVSNEITNAQSLERNTIEGASIG